MIFKNGWLVQWVPARDQEGLSFLAERHLGCFGSGVGVVNRVGLRFDAAWIARLISVASAIGVPMRRARSNWLPLCVLSLVSAALVMAMAPSVFAQANARREHKRMERAQIIALEHEWQQATLSNDISVMDRLLSEDYLGITADGEVLTKAQQLDRMRERRLVITQLNISETKIKLIGRIAIVTCLARIQGTSDRHPVDGAYRYTRVYQRLPGGVWTVTNFEVTPALQLHPAEALQ